MRQTFLQLFVRSLWVFSEQRFCGEDDATQAKAALRGLLFDEGLLNGMRLLGSAKAFECGYFLLFHRTHRRYTRADCHAAHEHGACSALRHAAAELGPAQVELIAQHV